VLLGGGELFTGNALMLAALLDKRVSLSGMLRNWLIVYAGNFAGSLLIAFLLWASGLFASGDGMLGAVTLRIAASKANLGFMRAFVLGILCNWLVCMAVWLFYGADTAAGKILGIFFPIWLFIASGFEHSIANMYYIPAGMLAARDASFAALSRLSAAQTARLNPSGFLVGNLLPVTLGNIVGGGVFVGMLYWAVYGKRGK
jgi:formate/nitrite transporter